MKQLLKRGISLLVVFVLQFSTVVYAGEVSEGTIKHEGEMVEATVTIEQQDTELEAEQEPEIEQELEAEVEQGTEREQEPEAEVEQEPEAEVEQETETDQLHYGWYQADGGWYYYNQSGQKMTGWVYAGNKWYYLDGGNQKYPGLMVSNSKHVIAGNTYFFDSNGAMRTGWILTKEGWYYASGSGAMVTGWLWQGNVWYYLDAGNTEYPGLMVSDCRRIINGATYFFGTSGAMRTGWIHTEEGWYYNDNVSSTGWKNIGGLWYYMDPNNVEYPGLMAVDCKRTIDGSAYFFDGNGVMRTGWILTKEGWYYTGGSGAMVTGWLWYGNVWYYLDAGNTEYPGLMVSDCRRIINGATYFFGTSGAMRTGWIHTEEGWYYSDNVSSTGWKNISGLWYYMDPGNTEYPGLMIAGCKKDINGVIYRFNPSGAMLTGWCQEDGDWYYLDRNGAVVSGWSIIDGTWYYLDPKNENKMVYGGWNVINGSKYYFHSNGAMAINWIQLGGDWYYLASDGAMKTGWQYVNGYWYYLYTANDSHGGQEGVMAKDTTIDGYVLSGSGAMLTEADMAARSVLDRVGWNLRAAYNWSAGLTYYRMTADPSPGSEWFANYGFQNGKGNCYVMAATFCYMARQLGYDAHQVAGMVPRRGGGVTPHSWCEIVIGGTTYVFDPNFTNETGRNGYQITYGTSGTWRYSSYYRIN